MDVGNAHWVMWLVFCLGGGGGGGGGGERRRRRRPPPPSPASVDLCRRDSPALSEVPASSISPDTANADSCSASGNGAAVTTGGSESFSDIPRGTYSYTLNPGPGGSGSTASFQIVRSRCLPPIPSRSSPAVNSSWPANTPIPAHRQCRLRQRSGTANVSRSSPPIPRSAAVDGSPSPLWSLVSSREVL